MNVLDSNLSDTIRANVDSLFDSKSPILLEVRFPRMATSSDWYLCNSPSDFEAIWEKLGAGVEVQFRSVWDLQDTERPLTIGK